MRERGLKARKKKRGVDTADSGHSPPAAENLLNRKCSASGPGETRVSGITYLKTNNGWLYVTVILDLWDRSVVGRAFSEDMEAGHVCDALMTARTNRRPKSGLLFHSDRGVQYCGKEFRDALAARRPLVGRSMSRKRNCWDNACAERFFKALKAETDKVKGRQTKEEERVAVFEYIEPYYNKRRRHSALGYADL
jgi:transposase InsO family protein